MANSHEPTTASFFCATKPHTRSEWMQPGGESKMGSMGALAAIPQERKMASTGVAVNGSAWRSEASGLPPACEWERSLGGWGEERWGSRARREDERTDGRTKVYANQHLTAALVPQGRKEPVQTAVGRARRLELIASGMEKGGTKNFLHRNGEGVLLLQGERGCPFQGGGRWFG